jgi:hypothetical protein
MMQKMLASLVEVLKWKGIDNLTKSDRRVSSGYFRVFNNFDIDDEGMVHGRLGISELALSGNWHSVFGDGKDVYGVRNGDLVRVYLVGATWTVSTVLTSVGSSRMNYVKVYDRIFFSNRYIGLCVPRPKTTTPEDGGW